MNGGPGAFAFGDQEGDDLPGCDVAEQLSEFFFVKGDSVGLHKRNKIIRREARQGGFAKMGILRDKGLGARVGIGKVAATAARDENLGPHLFGMIEHDDPTAAFAGLNSAHHPRPAGPENDDIPI